jgi:valyl-tRNA synthetase
LPLEEAIARKRDPKTIADSYLPYEVEAYWNRWWQERRLYHADPEHVLSGRKQPFVMCFPPPNVTGYLHIGHALTSSIQDAIARFRRMQGREVCFLPGLDHAGIATQSIVEKELMKAEGLTKHDLGRE